MSVQISKPIVYGTISTWLGKKADEKKTHQWICYVRGVNNEDLSYFIDKVVFNLHNSFEQPERGSNTIIQQQKVVNQHPFVIQEFGWGQFEIKIQIFLKGNYDSPLVVFHMLKLYHSQNQNVPLTRKPIVHEQYDEIVFVNPKPDIVEMLKLQPELPIPLPILENTGSVMEDENDQKDMENENMTAQQYLKSMQQNFMRFDEKELKSKLEVAINFVQTELLQDQIRKVFYLIFNSLKTTQLDKEIQELQIEAEKLQQQINSQE